MRNTIIRNNRNLLSILFLGLMTFGIGSCDLVDEATKVEFDMSFISSVEIPASSGLNLPFNLFTPDIETDSEATFGVNNTKKELVEKVNLTSMNLTITSPNDQRFDFLDEITVYIKADGLDEIQIAYAENIPENIGNELELTVTGNNLKDYIIEDEFTLRVNTVANQTISEDIDIKVASEFNVIADVL
ncbi:MAG: hypothetical protein AB8G11_17650 [Saprospiraceae bacterium]